MRLALAGYGLEHFGARQIEAKELGFGVCVLRHFDQIGGPEIQVLGFEVLKR